MKKLQILALSMLLSTTCIVQAKLDKNGFSDIRATNRRDANAREDASDNRIAEEMGDPVTFNRFSQFKEKTIAFIEKLSVNDKKNKEIAVAAVIDLFRALNKIENVRLSGSAKEELEKIKSQLQALKLDSKLNRILNMMA